MPDGNVAEPHDDFETDSLFGSPPPSPGRGRSSSPLALPGGQNSVHNVGTLALPGSHLYSELPSVPPPAPVNPSTSVARQRSQPPAPTQHPPPLRSATVPPTLAVPASCPVPPLRKKKRASRRTTPGSDARPTPPPIELPSPSDPPPANFLRNQQALLGHAGLVSGVHPANLSLQRHLRGKTPQNPIVVEDEDDQPTIGRRPPQSAPSTSRLPVPSSEEILQNLVKQKNLIPVMDALVRLVAGSAVPAPTPPSGTFHVPIAPPSNGQATHQPYPYPYYPYHYAYPPYYYSYPYGYTYPYASSPYQPPPAPTTSTDQPQIKKRKLSHVPAGASEWDVPYPFPDGQGPPDYYQNWQKLRGQQLVEDLVGLVKSAAKKAAVQKVQGEGSSGPAIGSVEYYRERVLRHYQPQGRYEGQPTPQPAPSPAVTPARSSTASKEAVVHSEPTPPSHEDHARIAVKVQHPTPAVPSPPMEGLVAPSTTASPAPRAPAASPPHVMSTATEVQGTCHAVPEGVHEEPSQPSSANTSEATPDQTLAQIADNTQHNIDDLLAIFNDLPAQDIDALLSSTDFSSINPEDFGFGAAFDMTGLSPADGEGGVGQETEAAASTSAADPHPFDIDFGFDPSIPLDIDIDPELLALSHPGPPPPTASEAAPQPAAEKPTVQISNMASGSGAPPTPTLVGSPMSHADFDPPTPEWNFQFPEPDIAGSERAGSEARSEQDAPQETPKDKGKARAVAPIDVDRADTPMPVDAPGAGTASRGSEAPDASTRRQFDIPTLPEWAPPPPPFTVLDVLGPLRKTLEAYLPAQRSRVPSLLVAPPAVPAKPAGATQAKDREDILRRARAMRAQLQEEIERAKVELWETAMEGGCLAVLAKERDKLVEKKS